MNGSPLSNNKRGVEKIFTVDCCIKNGEKFSLERQGPFRICRVKTAEGAAIRDALVSDPDRLVRRGEVFKPGSRGYALGVEIGGRNYFLKVYDCLGLGYRLRNVFRSSRALRTWRVTWELYLRGLPVPKPLVAIEDRHFQMLGQSYLVTEIISDACDLVRYWQHIDYQTKRELLSRLGNLIGKMHRLGGSHGDLKWNNILVRSGDIQQEAVLVDTDSARISFGPKKRRIKKDLDRFLRDLKKYEKDSFFYDLFLNCWNYGFNEKGNYSWNC